MEVAVAVPNSEASWRFNPEVLVSQIRKRWPSADIKLPTRATACSWWIRLPDSPGKTLSGFLNPVGTIVGFEGDASDCLAFALWLRSIVPDSVMLVLGDDQHGEVLSLRVSSTERDIVAYWQSV
jgi:hypothetical protein